MIRLKHAYFLMLCLAPAAMAAEPSSQASAERSSPMAVTGVETVFPVVPVLRRKAYNPVHGFIIRTNGNDKPLAMENVELTLEGTTRPQDIEAVELFAGTADPSAKPGAVIGRATTISQRVVISCSQSLTTGANAFMISVRLKENADIDGRVAVTLGRVKVGGKIIAPDKAPVTRAQRVGVALRLQGDDGSHSYRIPGLVRTRAGSLVAVYDIRYKHCGDLPARIDVGVSRSIDDGRKWEPMRIAMNTGTMGDAYQADGVGDPAVLVDEKSGRIWIAALWSHGNHGWQKSGPGMSPDETGQLLLTHSDDDGRTWSELRNITAMVKKPEWRLCFNGPGAGITMKNGTLVFAGQFRAADGGETKGKPFSNIIYSEDRGETWTMSEGCRIDTTEAQVVELADGGLMLNCRDNRGGSRTVMTTHDMGKTWQPHATDRKALPEPVCMASLLRWDHLQRGSLLIFSNPATTRGRNHMTLQVSRDGGGTWPKEYRALYDERTGAGYSCLAPAGKDHVGVLYEGNCELYFLRIPLADCVR